jgi:hypothetical protein
MSRDPRYSDGWRVKWKFLRVPLPFIEFWMPLLSKGELAVWLYVFRHTVGYKKRGFVTLKYSQIASGANRKDGKRADHGTGMTVAGVRAAIHSLIARKLIYTIPGKNDANSYRCNWSLPATVVAPENGSACYSGSTPDDSTVAGDPDWLTPLPVSKCAGDKLVSAPRRKARIVPIDNFIDTTQPR